MQLGFIKELITVFVPVVCQKSLFQPISLKMPISVSLCGTKTVINSFIKGGGFYDVDL
uniref:Uncharacterized protein n=1 Tax=Helianthus annuus TaxID=4232 RepID=A0A251U6N9_HELAN